MAASTRKNLSPGVKSRVATTSSEQSRDRNDSSPTRVFPPRRATVNVKGDPSWEAPWMHSLDYCSVKEIYTGRLEH